MRHSPGALAALTVALVSCAANASPLVMGSYPLEPIAARTSLVHRILIYAKAGSKKLIDGRWNLRV